MTAPDVVELGRRAVACPGWRWLPGMLCLDGLRIDGVDSEGGPYRAESYGDEFGERVNVRRYGEDRPLPNMTDPPTLGALLGLVREAWRGHVCFVPNLICVGSVNQFRWFVTFLHKSDAARINGDHGHESEAAALVAALVAAPARS